MGNSPSSLSSDGSNPSSLRERHPPSDHHSSGNQRSGDRRPSLRPTTVGPRPGQVPSSSMSRSYPPPPSEGSGLRRGVSASPSAAPTLGPYPSPRSCPNSLSMRAHLPVRDPPLMQRSGVVPNVLNIRKDSLKIVRSPKDSCIYYLQFMFDAQVDGNVSIFYCAQQVFHRVGNSQFPDARIITLSFKSKDGIDPVKTPFVAGDSQIFQQTHDRGLDVRQYKSVELQRVDIDRYPIVIQLEAEYPSDSKVPAEERVVSQTTFAKLVPKDGTFILKIISQQVLVNGNIYKILNLYGIGGKEGTTTKTQNDALNTNTPDECVVCLTEPCDTACEPCSHLCLCEDCARTLWSQPEPSRRKCPVCRSELNSLLRIIPARDSPQRSTHVPQTDVQSPSILPV